MLFQDGCPVWSTYSDIFHAFAAVFRSCVLCADVRQFVRLAKFDSVNRF